MIKEKKAGTKISSVILTAALSFVFLLFLLRSDVAINYMKNGLKLCAGTVIPSLFPFMVVSSLLVSSGVGMRLCRPLSLPARLIFGVTEGGACAALLGAICGFPIGAKVACSMYDKGMMSKKETERVLTFCNNPGSAFVISAVGVSLFGSFKVGVILYSCVLLSALITGVLMRTLHKIDDRKITTEANLIKARLEGSANTFSLFIGAVQDSALSMLTVCAMVAFFSSLVGCVGVSLSALGVTEAPIAAIFGICELSSGVSALAALRSPYALPLCAAALGWSGISVHCQIMAIAGGRGLSFKPYFAAKAIQGGVSAALAWTFTKLFPKACQVFSDSTPNFAQEAQMTNAIFSLLVLFCAVAVGIAVVLGGNYRKNQGSKKSKKKIKKFSKRG